MEGVAILTEARSGSEWLASLTNSAGTMGRSKEWLDPYHLKFDPDRFEELFAAVIEKSSTPNGRFGVKLFPSHLRWSQENFGADFLAECRRHHRTNLILLERRDRHRQAISFCRGKMTGQWKASIQETGVATYDFGSICRAYFWIEQSYAFWKSYLGVFDLEHDHFFYEDLLDDPTPYVTAVARALDVEPPVEMVQTALRVQRDTLTEEWLERFRSDLKGRGVMRELQDSPSPRTLGNLRRFLSKRSMR